LIPSERSSGRRQRLGKLSKEGNAPVRYLWGEATIHAVRRDPELKRGIARFRWSDMKVDISQGYQAPASCASNPSGELITSGLPV